MADLRTSDDLARAKAGDSVKLGQRTLTYGGGKIVEVWIDALAVEHRFDEVLARRRRAQADLDALPAREAALRDELEKLDGLLAAFAGAGLTPPVAEKE